MRTRVCSLLSSMRTRIFSLPLCALLLAAGPARHDEFALNLFAQLRSRAGNVVVSPANVLDALTLIERAAGGATRRELDEAMRGALPVRNPAIISSAALWGDSVTLRPSYAAALHELGGSLQATSFANPLAACQRINAWASAATKGHIKHVIDPGSIGPDTRLVVTTTLYMKVAWRDPFSFSNTRPMPFHLDGRTAVSVPTMEDTLGARYAAVGRVRLLELPYAAKGLSMLIILPESAGGLPAVEAALTPSLLTRWSSALQPHDLVEVTLPRFHVESDFDLQPALKKLGIVRLLDRSNGAALPGIVSKRKLYVSGVMHSVRIDVDEEGTEASAYTGDTITGTMVLTPPKPLLFHVDHPFLYLVRSGDQIVFLGRIADPRG